MNTAKKLHIVENRTTLDRITNFEYAELIAKRINDIGGGSEVRVNLDDLTIPIDEYDKKVSKTGKEIFNVDDKFFIVEDDTNHIARIELNKGKCPLLLLRKIKETDTDVYAELVDPNFMIKPL